VIDGGEWMKGAGEFNILEAIPEALWDQLETMIKRRRGVSSGQIADCR